MTTDREFNVPHGEPDFPGSFYARPEMLKALEQTSRGEPLTWGATPLEPYRKDVAEQQREVGRKISELFPKRAKTVPFGLSWDTARFIEDNYIMRTQRRVSRNYDNYQYRGKFDISDIPQEALGFVERCNTGHASPAEIMATIDMEQIAAADVATLTIPYGQRIEHLEPMREAIREGAAIHGGELLPLKPTLEVRNANFLTPIYEATEPSLLMTRTYDTAKIDVNTKIMERSSFNVVLPRLAPELSQVIQEIQYNEEWSARILALRGFEKAVLDALSANRHEVAVPVSVTALEVNYRLVKKLLENKQHIRDRTMLINRRAMEESAKPSMI